MTLPGRTPRSSAAYDGAVLPVFRVAERAKAAESV